MKVPVPALPHLCPDLFSLLPPGTSSRIPGTKKMALETPKVERN